jgi:hypothetical protein
MRSPAATAPSTALMYVFLKTLRPSVSEFRLKVKGTDDFGGVAYSSVVTAKVQ